MSEDTVLPFHLPSVCRKKVSVGFDGGQLSSDAGVLLLRGIEKRLGIVARLASCLRDKRDPDLILHTVEEMLRLRMFAIAAGYEDADDCDFLRYDPIFKMAVGRLPRTGEPLCSQPTMSRLENAPSKIEVARAMAAMVDQFCTSYRRAPAAITLDIDDTFDAVHGHQQLSLFNAHYDERCYVVTSLNGTAKHLYETVYCGRGRCENFIKWHKAQLASDRTSCRDPKANQFRLILHTAAYWLMLTARNAIAKRLPLAVAEFATLRLRLIKIAARVIEGTARIRVHLPTACPDRAVFRQLAGRLCAAGP